MRCGEEGEEFIEKLGGSTGDFAFAINLFRNGLANSARSGNVTVGFRDTPEYVNAKMKDIRFELRILCARIR